MNRHGCLGVCGLLLALLAGTVRAQPPDLLTPDERQWLQAHGPLRYAPDPAFPPFEFFRPDGRVAGITPEILDLMSRRLGTTIQTVRYPTWPAVLEGIGRGEADFLGTLTRTAEREQFLAYTGPYLTVPNVLFVSSTSRWSQGFPELSGRRVGVVRSSGAHNWLLQHHPEVQVVPVTNTRDGMRLLSLDQLDAMLEALPVASFVITEQGYTNLRELPEIVFTVPQHLAVRLGDDRLRGILEKGLASVPMEERMRIFVRWTGEDPNRPRWLVPPWVWRWGGVLLAVIAASGIWNYTLRREVARRTRALQASEQQFRRLLEDLPMAAAWTSEDGRIEFLNHKFTALFGYTRADMPDVQQWFALAYPDPAYREKVVTTWRTDMDRIRRQGGGAHAQEVQITCKDGSVRTVLIVGSFSDGKVFAILDDLTDRQRVESQLRQAQKMEAVGQLAGGVAHDFNNLLTVVLGQSTLLLEDPALTPDQRTAIRQIADVARRAADLTRQLLTFSRKQAMQARPIDLNETLQAMHQLLVRLLGERITIRLEGAPGLPAIDADPGMIEQVVLNLAVNARDAMPRGGMLTLATRDEEVTPASLSLRPVSARPGRFVVLTVTDNGVGIPSTLLPHLFEPFFTTKEVGKGTGLGLATVYGIVQQHQGWIEVDSAPARGTTMRVYLPASAARPAQVPAAAPGWSRAGSETILLVEDEAPVRELIRRCLERAGYSVLEAGHSEEALVVWASHRDRVQLLFTDLVMPGSMDGRELSLRLLREKPSLRVVYATGYGRNILSDMPEGAACLTKPFDTAQLLALVRQSLDRPA
jgi:PAS domain S-box-containing protein